MAENEDIQPLVCDNGTGMVKVINHPISISFYCSMMIVVLVLEKHVGFVDLDAD